MREVRAKFFAGPGTIKAASSGIGQQRKGRVVSHLVEKTGRLTLVLRASLPVKIGTQFDCALACYLES